MAETKLTHNTDERQMRRLFDKNTIYQVPLFQRAYRWMPAKVKKFEIDLLTTLESDDDLHFLGAVIIHRVDSNFPDVEVYEIIDGQQRVTTVYLHLVAAAMILAGTDDGVTDAQRFLFTYLINNEFTYNKAATIKLQPSRDDRQPLNDVLKRLLSTGDLRKQTEKIDIAYLTQSAPQPSKRIEKNFNDSVRFFREQQREGGNALVKELVETMLGQFSVVVINVIDPLNGPKIFDSLNSGQEPMTVGDLVRNDIFARESKLSVEDLEDNHWKPFFEGFGDPSNGLFENYFFPFGLIEKPNVKKADIYQKLRESWVERKLSGSKVIEDLGEYQPDYMMLQTGQPISAHSGPVGKAFKRFYLMRATSALLPFTMRLSREVRSGSFDPGTCVDILAVLDSFLTRRATVGQEPTGLHALFKTLWADAENLGTVSVDAVRAVMSSAKTVQWPTDEDFAKAIRERRLYGVKVTPYLLHELNRALGGDVDDELDFSIEHVLPQTPAAGWEAFSAQERALFDDTLANLLPLTQAMNIGVSNGPYAGKRPIFQDDSKYKMTRKFAAKYADWNPDALRARADILATEALARWPYGPSAS